MDRFLRTMAEVGFIILELPVWMAVTLVVMLAGIPVVLTGTIIMIFEKVANPDTECEVSKKLFKWYFIDVLGRLLEFFEKHVESVFDRTSEFKKDSIIAVKGFDYDERTGELSCRGKKYKPGRWYFTFRKPVLCATGFHACDELWKTWMFYPNNGNRRYYYVECAGRFDRERGDDMKFACSRIRLLDQVDTSKVEKFTGAWQADDGKMLFIERDGRTALMTKEGRRVSRWYDDIRRSGYSNDFIVTKCIITDRYVQGMIGQDGNVIVPLEYNMIVDKSEGLTLVIDRERGMNFVKADGTYLTDEWWDSANNHKNGYAVVIRADGTRNYIDVNGNLLSDRWLGYADVDNVNGIWKIYDAKGVDYITQDNIRLFGEFRPLMHENKCSGLEKQLHLPEGWSIVVTEYGKGGIPETFTLYGGAIPYGPVGIDKICNFVREYVTHQTEQA